ncbi:MAG: sigma-70 family RNA polymerase sigma factor [Lachnospiraceae bacterium]|nr:sigma-70 family RNA polymerase sigma factor [Lachnospiraceae bacterium]
MEDSQIIDLFLHRNSDAIRETEIKYGAYCMAIANRILHNHEDSEECVNDTWLKAWNSIPPLIPVRLKLYLAKIARNIAVNRFQAETAMKRGGTEQALVLEELEECIADSSNVEKEFEARELDECVRTFVRELPEKEGNVFVRRYFFTESAAEIAERYQMTENNVMVVLCRVRKKLKKRLRREGFFGD